MATLREAFIAVETALMADGSLTELLSGRKVLGGRVPVGVRNPLDYITLTAPGEGPGGRGSAFGARSASGAIALNIWARDILAATTIYGHVSSVLEGRSLPMESGVMLSGTIRLLYANADADDETIIHAPCRYEYETWQ